MTINVTNSKRTADWLFRIIRIYKKKTTRSPALMLGIAVSTQQGHSTLSLSDWVLKLPHKS